MELGLGLGLGTHLRISRLKLAYKFGLDGYISKVYVYHLHITWIRISVVGLGVGLGLRPGLWVYRSENYV